jgi:amino acid transporter
VASVASALAGTVGAVWPPVDAPAGRAVLLAALFVFLAAVNVRGVTFGARLVETVTVAKLLPLIILVAVGFWSVNPEFVRLPAFPPAATVARTAIVLIFAFLGVEVALVPSGEVRDPARTVPRALFLALAITTTLYLLIQRVTQGLLGPAIRDFASAPLAEAASRVLGPGGRVLVTAGAIVSMFGYVAGDMLGSPRSLYAFGRDGIMPAVLTRVHPRFHTPHVAIVTYAVLVAALAISSTFTQLAILANVAALTLYLLCVAASYQLQRRNVVADGVPFRLPAGPLVPLLAASVIVWLLSNATLREFGVELLVVAVTSMFYFIRVRGGQL